MFCCNGKIRYTSFMNMSSNLTTPSAALTCSPVAVSSFLRELQALKGTPYIWDGKNEKGLDCSGCMTFALLRAGGEDVRNTYNCGRLIMECTPVKPIDYQPGMLAFYGFLAKAPDHVMALVQSEKEGLGLTAYGACGGNHYTTTPELAKKIGAKVQERGSIAYRHDFIGVFKWSRVDLTR
jgi:hypothetical protein